MNCRSYAKARSIVVAPYLNWASISTPWPWWKRWLNGCFLQFSFQYPLTYILPCMSKHLKQPFLRASRPGIWDRFFFFQLCLENGIQYLNVRSDLCRVSPSKSTSVQPHFWLCLFNKFYYKLIMKNFWYYKFIKCCGWFIISIFFYLFGKMLLLSIVQISQIFAVTFLFICENMFNYWGYEQALLVSYLDALS